MTPLIMIPGDLRRMASKIARLTPGKQTKSSSVRTIFDWSESISKRILYIYYIYVFFILPKFLHFFHSLDIWYYSCLFMFGAISTIFTIAKFIVALNIHCLFFYVNYMSTCVRCTYSQLGDAFRNIDGSICSSKSTIYMLQASQGSMKLNSHKSWNN